MKAVRVMLVLVFVFGLIGISTTPSQAQSFVSYVSGLTMQNLSSTTETVTADYYDLNGTIVFTSSDSIAGFGVKDYATIPVPTAGFTGSLVISSAVPVGAVTTLRGDLKGRDSYIGVSTGGAPVLLPVIMKNWGSSAWNTWFTVQNTGMANADVQVSYAACSGVNQSKTGLKPNTSVTFAQAAEPCMTAAKTLTSATVTSTQPIVVEVVQESTVVNSLLASPGFSTGDTAPVMPLLNVNNPNTTGWRTAISIFNMGLSPTNVTLTYVNSADGVTCTETSQVTAGNAKVFAGNNLINPPPAGTTTTCTAGKRIIGSAYVSVNSANQPLVATVNQDRGSLASAYGGMAPSAATPKVVFPQIQDRNGAASQWASSFMVMNVSGHGVFVKCTFANTAVTANSGATALGDYKSWENLQRGTIAAGYVGSGECTAYTSSAFTTVDSTAKIVAVVNIRGLGVGLYDLMMSYNAINVTP